ncbi:UNVERIFIED_CONTAM: hypothetical protein HDU68_012905, partial [Siphonaria sp. JEL0065]
MLLLAVIASIAAVSNAAVNVQYKSDYTGPRIHGHANLAASAHLNFNGGPVIAN